MEKETLYQGVCQELADAFRVSDESFKRLFEALESAQKSIIEGIIISAQHQVAKYMLKTLEANFLTRWYCRRKLKKAEEYYSQLINQSNFENP